MAFTTPCFVRVEDAAERKKLIEWCNKIGRSGEKDYKYGDVVLCIKDTTYCCSYEEAEFVADDTTIDAGTNVELFRALAAMNDENDRKQWFTDGKDWGIAEWDMDENDPMLNVTIGPEYRKATAEEIVEYFKKREK